ncbi:MAG: ASKHA domain-containing protein, partial [Nitrososphaerales archaeon]
MKPGSIVVTVPPESRIGHQRMIIQGVMPRFKVSPMVVKTIVRLKKTQGLKDIGADSDRLLYVLKAQQGYAAGSISLEAMRRLPEVLREGGWVVSVVLWGGREVLSLEPRDTQDRLFGFAVDVGTTKLAGYLIDLKKGELLAAASLPNPQLSFGEDLISRITYWSEGEEKGRELQQAVVEGVNRLIKDACKDTGVSSNEIYDLTVAGNTAMHHIFFGISPRYVALSPFPVAVKTSFDVKAKDLKVEANPAAYIHALPPIAGFVGADTVAGILATEIYKSEETSMLIDIGTNAEIVIGNKEELTCCSSPAGPAFEGRHIKHGMRASSGAIETIWIDPEDYSVGYKTVDDAKPRGICGSGIIDAVAQMFKTGVIGRTGRFNRTINVPRVRAPGRETEFVIAWRKETGGQEDITITSRDVQEVLLAKAAIYSGASILLKRLNLVPEDIKRLYIAGAFGTYVDLTSSLTIGMYPEIPVSRARFVGNTAGSGARMALLSREMRLIADK